MLLKPLANILTSSAIPSSSRSIRILIVSPGVFSRGFLNCGPCVTNARPRRSKAKQVGFLIRGSLANKLISNPVGRVGNLDLLVSKFVESATACRVSPRGSTLVSNLKKKENFIENQNPKKIRSAKEYGTKSRANLAS